MDSETKKNLIVRIPCPSDDYGWEIFAPDGTPMEGWYMASIRQDHSGRHVLNIAFDQFDCIDAEGKHLEIEMKGMPIKPLTKEEPLPSPRSHKIPGR